MYPLLYQGEPVLAVVSYDRSYSLLLVRGIHEPEFTGFLTLR